MKHSIAVKFITIVLCALSVVSVAACGFGILFMENYNLYNEPLEDLKQEQLESMADKIAWYYAQQHAAETLSNCPQEILNNVLYSSYLTDHVAGKFAVEIRDNNRVVYELGDPESMKGPYVRELEVAPYYPIVTYQYTISENQTFEDMWETGDYAVTIPAGEPAENTEPTVSDDGVAAAASTDADTPAWSDELDEALALVEDQEVLFTSTESYEYWDENSNCYNVVYTLDYYQGPTYDVTVYLAEDAVLGTEYALMSVMYPYRDSFIPLLLVSLLVFAVTLVYLCAAAGHAKNGEIRPAALNRLPLDLYALIAGVGIVLLAWLLVELLDTYYAGYYSIWDNIPLCGLIVALCVFGMALLGIGLIYAFAAQLKMKDGYWWRHSIVGFLLSYIVRGLRWISRGFHYAGKGLCAVFRLLPVIWQWLLVAFLMVLSVGISFFGVVVSWDFWNFFWSILLVLSIAGCIAVVCYGGYCFGTLMKGAKAMAHGNLNHQIPTKYMLGAFKDFAIQLNSLAGAAQIAAEKQMKSERMKTELITNVSHDIKTPLTSIINYVDLLKKPHTDSDGVLYLEVLDRQSQRLKKLIDDLMEMSKASTGNLAVELGRVDAVEAINQALGEFGDKLASVNLTPVFRYPEFPVTMMADGRLVWRVLSNLLSNAVKYALPDTRLYIDLMCLQGNAVIAIKNISRDQLNVNVDELMERFVRGDSSRNTEGSGLGLNIAKSLVELQHGQMHLMVDGDLFKVTLIFPLA